MNIKFFQWNMNINFFQWGINFLVPLVNPGALEKLDSVTVLAAFFSSSVCVPHRWYVLLMLLLVSVAQMTHFYPVMEFGSPCLICISERPECPDLRARCCIILMNFLE